MKAQQQQSKFNNVGRISLWAAPNEAKYVASGTIKLDDGQTYRVVLFDNSQAENPKAPTYSGYVSLEDEASSTKKSW